MLRMSIDPRAYTSLALAMLLCFGLMSSCSGRKKVISSNGLYGIKLGDQLPPAGVDQFKGISVRDTLLEEREFAWRAALMEYKQGLVYLEEDFSRNELLNRIRVETPELKLKNGLRVGKTVEDLQKINGEWYISPLTEYRLFDFYTRLFPNIHFLVDDRGTDISDPDWENYRMDMFSPEAPIVAIVIF